MDFILYVADDGTVSVINQQDLRNKALHLGIEKLDSDKNSKKSKTSKDVLKDEVDAKGKVAWNDYKTFFSFSVSGKWGIVLVLALHVVINICTVAVSIYLGLTLTSKLNATDEQTNYIIVLSIIIVVALLSSFLGKLISNKIFLSISSRLHNKLVSSILHTDLAFFEENTCGRIVNRFSKDVKTLDQFVFVFLEMTDYTVKCMFSTAIVIYLYPALILFAVLQLMYLIRLRKQGLCATRDTIRLKFSLYSPINSLIQDAVNGLPTLKCLNKIQFYMKTLFKSIDTQTSAFITSSSGNRWVAFRIDI